MTVIVTKHMLIVKSISCLIENHIHYDSEVLIKSNNGHTMISMDFLIALIIKYVDYLRLIKV